MPDRLFDAAVATFLFCVLPDDMQVPALREIGRVVKPGEHHRPAGIHAGPHGTFRRAMTRLWEPWVRWAYGGGSFDRRTEEHVPQAGLRLAGSRFVVDDLIKVIEARVTD